MNVEKIIRTDKKLALPVKTLIHFSLVSNKIRETIALALKPHAMSEQQFNVLRILRGQKQKPTNLCTINERMVTKMSNTTRLVDKLIVKGYVDRKVCTQNRRKVEITITKAGMGILHELDKVMERTEKELLQKFNDKELITLNLLLDKF